MHTCNIATCSKSTIVIPRLNHNNETATSAQEQREGRLQRRRERERANCAAETAERRETRLARRRARARIAAKMEEQRPGKRVYIDVKGSTSQTHPKTTEESGARLLPVRANQYTMKGRLLNS